MRCSLLALSLMIGCSPDKGPTVPRTVDSSTGDADDTQAADTARDDTGEAGETGAHDTAPPEEPSVESEELPDFFEDEPSLCQMVLQCDDTIPDEPKTGCKFQVTQGDGHVAYRGYAGVETRGRSSASFPKPQYALELWDSDGADLERDLLGFGPESDWVLNGAWVDRALFRNKLTYDLFQAMGGPERYAAQSAFCELELNGDYRGIYLLTERIKRAESRVDISDAGELDGSSFVVKLDSGGFMANSLGYGYWNLVYPRESAIGEDALAGITATLSAWEAAASGSAPDDPDTGIFAYVDLDSAVDFVIIEEFAKNNDAYFLSIHLWQDEGGLIHFVPWDIDLGYGQPSYNNNEPPEEWVLYRPALISTMSELPVFQERLVERWAELRETILTDEALQERVEGYLSTMGDAVDRNFERWPIEDVAFGSYLYEIESHDAEVERVGKWIQVRVRWMDDNIASY